MNNMNEKNEKYVVKFGGSSLADANQFRKVKDIIESDKRRRFVVPSAPGKRFSEDTKVTDMLYSCYKKVLGGGNVKEEFSPIAERFNQIISDLGLEDFSLKDEYSKIATNFRKKAGEDYAASRGEYLNGMILAKYLGFSFIDAAEVIRFNRKGELDEGFTNASLVTTLERKGFAVIPGFYGAMPDGKIKTFSRGGSDYTGSIVAKAVKADLYENWTDVSGFLVADPRIVENPDVIKYITYRELRELSYMGATVLHEDSIFPVRAAEIPINVRNTNEPMAPGTLILPAAPKGDTPPPLTGIAGKKGFSVIHMEKDGMNNEIGFLRKILTLFETLGINFEHVPTGIDTLSIVLATSELEKCPDITDHLREAARPNHIVVEQGSLAMIAVVGRGMVSKQGTAAKIFTALKEAEINIRIIDQGSCEFNVIVGVNEDDFEKAIKALYSIYSEGI